MPNKAFAALPCRLAFPRAACIVSRRPWSAATATRNPGYGKPKDGQRGLTRLVVATLSTFGLKRGVGLDTMSECFAHLPLEMLVGCSPSALHGALQALEAALLETAAAWEKEGRASGEVCEVVGAVDATFLERLILICMDLTTGYLLFEEVAEDRSYVTWKALVDEGYPRKAGHRVVSTR